MSRGSLRLFEGFGIELEYMLVDRDSLDVRPVADQLLFSAAGEPANDVELGDVAWSNELVLHVLELKCNGPAPSLRGLARRFQAHLAAAQELLEPLNAMLLPTAMHPWMDPATETRLWPHELNEVYRAYDRIFSARGHGWANLQSTHINLPFGDDREFGRLHAAIRPVLALIPALAASSPFADARASGVTDTRLEHYRNNQRRIPSLTGWVIPEPARSEAEYRATILDRLYRDIAPYDPDRVLRHEWLNSRGAIARFERGAIEIRLVDLQECPRADLAVVALVVAVVRALVEERWVSIPELDAMPEQTLHQVFLGCVARGSEAVVDEPGLLRALGFPARTPLRARELWAHLAAELVDPALRRAERWDGVYEIYADQGTLSERLLRRVGRTPPVRDQLRELFQELAGGLRRGRAFVA